MDTARNRPPLWLWAVVAGVVAILTVVVVIGSMHEADKTRRQQEIVREMCASGTAGTIPCPATPTSR